MNILHVSSITNNEASGMSVVVPLHVIYQGVYAQTALLNCSKVMVTLEDESIPTFNISDSNVDRNFARLPSPFNIPDLVVIHGVYIPYYIKIMKWLIVNNIPYILVPHGSLSESAQKIKPFKKIIGNLFFFNQLMKNAAAIQFLSENERNSSRSYKKKSFIGCNGMNTGSRVKEYKNYNEIFNIIYVGRLDAYHKGLDLLVEAINLIKDEMRYKKISLSLYGPDHNNGFKTLENLIKKYEIADIVSLQGPIFGEQKITKLLEADIFIQTSRFEGQPLGVMESLALGIPVIITPGTNMAYEVKKNNCGWVADFSSEDIAKKILESHSNRNNLPFISKKAVSYMNNTYDWSKVAMRAVNSYEEVLNNI